MVTGFRSWWYLWDILPDARLCQEIWDVSNLNVHTCHQHNVSNFSSFASTSMKPFRIFVSLVLKCRFRYFLKGFPNCLNTHLVSLSFWKVKYNAIYKEIWWLIPILILSYFQPSKMEVMFFHYYRMHIMLQFVVFYIFKGSQIIILLFLNLNELIVCFKFIFVILDNSEV